MLEAQTNEISSNTVGYLQSVSVQTYSYCFQEGAKDYWKGYPLDSGPYALSVDQRGKEMNKAWRWGWQAENFFENLEL